LFLLAAHFLELVAAVSANAETRGGFSTYLYFFFFFFVGSGCQSFPASAANTETGILAVGFYLDLEKKLKTDFSS
jgi:hypothetical protein